MYYIEHECNGKPKFNGKNYLFYNINIVRIFTSWLVRSIARLVIYVDDITKTILTQF